MTTFRRTAAMSSPTDQPASAVGHDPAAAARIEQLYASHVALVRSICHSLLRDRSEVEDAVQQTFLSAQRAIVNGSSPRDGAAWLATIARHESLARVRARMRAPLPVELEEGDLGSDAHSAAVLRQEAGELRDALAELPAQQREAILLREVRGLSYQEVAASLSVTTSAVESLLFRARRSLQTRLREALAAFSPAGWLGELVARIADGGTPVPAAAKAAAVGIGTIVAAGGAVVGPIVIGAGHAPTARIGSPPAARQRVPVHGLSTVPWVAAQPRRTPVVVAFHPRVARPKPTDSRDSRARTATSDDQRSPDTHEVESSSDATAAAATGDGSSHETGDDRTSSTRARTSHPATTDDGSSDDGSSDDGTGD
jgi:RNA polymerase sigma-70 factor, ECF subfamily